MLILATTRLCISGSHLFELVCGTGLWSMGCVLPVSAWKEANLTGLVCPKPTTSSFLLSSTHQLLRHVSAVGPRRLPEKPDFSNGVFFFRQQHASAWVNSLPNSLSLSLSLSRQTRTVPQYPGRRSAEV